MAPPLRELVLNETRAHAVFANGRLRDHRFAVSLVCDELPDPRFNRTYVLKPAILTPESLEEISRDFLSVRLPLRLDIFLPIPTETESFLERKGFDLTEDYACEMVLGEPSTELKKNAAVRVEQISEISLNTFTNIMLRAFDTPSDMIATLRSILRRTVPRAIDHRGAMLYLAFLDDEPVGTLYFFSQGGVGGAYYVTVAESARRQNVATTLMLQALGDSQVAGDNTLCVQTRVGSFQEKFFERLGFYTMARRKRAIRKTG